ncbi:unnamed protein product, partial [Amoebophrya sp. A25]|eukprot:GSA25T00008838001.1
MKENHEQKSCTQLSLVKFNLAFCSRVLSVREYCLYLQEAFPPLHRRSGTTTGQLSP